MIIINRSMTKKRIYTAMNATNAAVIADTVANANP
jgi:hypothetical protein